MSYAEGRGENYLDDEFTWESEKPPGRRLWVVAAVVLGLVLIAAGILAGVRAVWKPALPPREVETAEQKWGIAAAAFAETPVPVEHAELPAIQALLDSYGAALRNGDAATVRDVFDFERMVRELERIGAFKNIGLLQRTLLPGQLRESLPDQIVANALFYGFQRFDIRQLAFDGDDEVVVYSRHWSEAGLSSKYRWWMHKSEGRWRIFDFEELEAAERFTDAMAAVVNQITPARAARMQRATESLGNVFQAIAAEDWIQAEQTLAMVNVADVPRAFQAKLHMAQATVEASFGRYEQALQACDRAEALHDMPILSYQRAVSHNGLGQYEQTLAAAQRYLDRLGPDSAVLMEMGVALAGLGRTEEAIETYRRGLRDDPEDVNLLLELGLILPTEGKQEVGEHFVRLSKPDEQFEPLCDAFLSSGDAESLAAIVAAYGAIRPEDPLLLYYDAQLKTERGEYEAAAEQVFASLGSVPEDRRQEFLELYLDAMRSAGKSLEGYARAPDPEHAFEYLAMGALYQSPDDELVRLLVAHRARRPDDPWLDYYTGRLAANHEDWDAAIDAYREGMRKLEHDQEQAASFHYPLSEAMARAGRAVEAYREFGADRESFTELGWLLSAHEQPEQLRALVEAFREDHPDDHVTPFWEAEAHFLAADYAAAAETIEENSSILMTHEETRWDSEDRLIRSLIHLQRFDEADSYARAIANRDDDVWYATLVAAARGDVAETERLLERCSGELYYDAYDFYSDPILAAALDKQAFRELREKYPRWDDPVEAPSPRSWQQSSETVGTE